MKRNLKNMKEDAVKEIHYGYMDRLRMTRYGSPSQTRLVKQTAWKRWWRTSQFRAQGMSFAEFREYWRCYIGEGVF